MTFTGLIVLILELDKGAADEFSIGGIPAVITYIDSVMLSRLRDEQAKHDAAGHTMRAFIWAERIKVIEVVREKLVEHFASLRCFNEEPHAHAGTDPEFVARVQRAQAAQADPEPVAEEPTP
jgi:hypothetical protein